MENVVVIGSGPAAHTAAVYSARAKLNPLMFEGFMAGGIAAGGQLTTTTLIENFPGFPEGITGPELMNRMRRQSFNCGARIETKTVLKVDLESRPFKIFANGNTIETKSIIIATGAIAKRLFVTGEERLWQKGISACAVCDAALPVFRNKHLFVVGGGDTAVEEATHLAHYASNVTMLVRRDVLRATKVNQDRVLQNKKIEIRWNTILLEILGESFVNALKVRNVKTNLESTLEASGLFYAIGHKPNTEFLSGQIALDEDGYILTQSGSTKTNVDGVFACGDVQDKIYRQAITAAGSGCMAAQEVERYLESHP